MEEYEGTVERIDFDASHEHPLVLLLKVGRARKLLRPRFTNSDIEEHGTFLRITRAEDSVRISINSGNYVKSFENRTLNSSRLLIS